MYTYTAGATGLDAAMPPWVLDGGYEALFKRLRDPAEAREDRTAMRTPTDEWENLLPRRRIAGRVLLVGFKNEALKPLHRQDAGGSGDSCAASDPVDTIMDLVLEDESRVGTVYFMMSEENIKKQIALPWVSLRLGRGVAWRRRACSSKSSTHPRAYGNFARLLGKYVRDEKVMPLEEAIRRLTEPAGDQSRARPSRRLEPEACSPTSSSSTRRRSPTAPRSRSRISSPSA